MINLPNPFDSALAPAMGAISPRRAFNEQRRCAHRRGIAWEFTFEGWCSVWEMSGHWNERGRGQGYVMCRKGDVGPYSAENVFIAPSRVNASEHPSRKKNLPIGVFTKPGRKTFQARRKLGGKRVELGTYPTAEKAHAAYLAAVGVEA